MAYKFLRTAHPGAPQKYRTPTATSPPMFTSLEVSTMNSDESKTPNAPPTDTSGKPVNVVERDLEDRDDDTEAVDEVITPSSTRVKEQDAETLQRKIDEIERKVADGN
jgi:hypothetical protein